MDFSKISSGKNSKTENFPVTSWFFLGHFRYHINTFYNFARAADDIADTNMLSSKEKIKQLYEKKEKKKSQKFLGVENRIK